MHWTDRVGKQLRPRDLHVFMAVVERRSMAKAAQTLAISRPVVSKTIAHLEHILGVRLLDRTARGIAPTMYGAVLLRRGSVVFDDLRQAIEEIAFLKDPQAGELRIACTEVWAAGIVPATIEALSREFPRLSVRMEQGTAEHQFNLLRDRRCEVVVSRLITSVPESDIEMQPMFNEPLVVVAGFRSSWARRRNIALSDLVNAPWILSSLELEDGSPFVKAFRAAGLAVPAATIVSNSLHVRNRLLEKGRFVSLVPGSALRFGPTRSALAPLPIRLPRWHLPTGAFILKERELSPLAQLFIERMREIARPLANAQWHP